MKHFTAVILYVVFCAAALFAEVSVEYFGGAGRVSGSCALLSAGGSSVIIDCGSFYQEDNLSSGIFHSDNKLLNAEALILTHSHIDHSGQIPYLISKGFKGKIYCTDATKELLFELYDDGWNFEDVKENFYWSSKRRQNVTKRRQGSVTVHWNGKCAKSIDTKETVKDSVSINELGSLYKIDFKPCKKCLKIFLNNIQKQFYTVNYNSTVKLSADLKFRLIDAGHIPGSASVVFDIDDDNKNITAVFSGDIGSGYSKLTGSKEIPPKADYIFVEATYGGQSRNIGFDTYDKFQKSVAKAVQDNKIVWIPSLALQRTQKVLYEIKQAQDKGLISKKVPVYSLSPSANEITELYIKKITNKNNSQWFVPREGTFLPDNYHTKREKKFPKPSIVISSSAMMDKGTSLYLIKQLLPYYETSVFFVSYVSPESPAGQLKRGKRSIRTAHGIVNSKASVENFDIFSDHPDADELLKWLGSQNRKVNIYLVHANLKNLQSALKILNKKGFINTNIVSQNKKIILK